jgi:radical SAM superfamily enzyme YgiQ (UPF0313 family)
MTAKRVTLIELSVYENMVPLVSGYLQAYACQDQAIADHYEFDIYARGLRDDPDQLAEDLIQRDSDIYAFSCYIWNMGLVRQVMQRLQKSRPDAYYLLGGPQVMNRAAEYVEPEQTKVVVCNGEGEQPFYEFLRAVATDEPDFDQVSSVSYWAGGELRTSVLTPRLKHLDELPSPFTAGIFDGGEYTFSVLETNRGCPFHCGFCFWGAATNSKVFKFDEDRVKADISWISENCIASVFIADANWGLSPRDVDLSKHIVACKQEHGFPTAMVIAAAKNRPERVSEITEILIQGGLVTSQPISLQTVSPDALKLIDRENIRESAYIDLQRTLNDKNMSSFIEMIWPLPGETLESFQAGVGRLCRMRADTLTIYPQLLLPNTSLFEQREALGIEVVRAPDDRAEADVVIATKWVTPEECVEGTWFYYAVQSLYNARAGYYLARYLDDAGILPFEDFFAAVSSFVQQRDDEISQFISRSVSTADNYDLLNIGLSAHLVLHSHRGAFDRLLYDFAQAQTWWSDPLARCALDIDLVARPYIYSEPFREPAVPASAVRWVNPTDRGVTVELPAEMSSLPARVGLVPPGTDAVRLQVEHPREGKMPHPRLRDDAHNAAYCHVMIQRLRTLIPKVTVLDGVAADAELIALSQQSA